MKAEEGRSPPQYFHAGKQVNDQIARQAPWQEEDRIKRGFNPEEPDGIPAVVTNVGQTRIRQLFQEWNQGRIDVAGLYREGGLAMATLFARANDEPQDRDALLHEARKGEGWGARQWRKGHLTDKDIIRLLGRRTMNEHYMDTVEPEYMTWYHLKKGFRTHRHRQQLVSLRTCRLRYLGENRAHSNGEEQSCQATTMIE